MTRNLLCLALAACFAAVAAPSQQPAPSAPAQNPPAAAQAPAAAPTQNGAAPTQPSTAQDAAGQAAQPGADAGSENSASTFRLGVNEASLIFTVTDSHGRYIPNLTQNDFALLDDQKAPEKV